MLQLLSSPFLADVELVATGDMWARKECAGARGAASTQSDGRELHGVVRRGAVLYDYFQG